MKNCFANIKKQSNKNILPKNLMEDPENEEDDKQDKEEDPNELIKNS